MRRLAVCDDNPKHLDRAARILQSYADEDDRKVQVELFGSIGDCLKQSKCFDAVFMDIEFGDEPQGIEAVARINAEAPACQIVYLTNYLHYSLDVYGTEHAWYVLKDQLEERLPEIFHKLDLISSSRRALVALEPIGEKSLVGVACNDIRYLERVHRKTRVMMRDGVSYEVRDKIADLLDKLPDTSFARCHYSYAVNLAQVEKIGSAELNLGDGDSLPISRSYSKKFRADYLRWLETRTV